MSRVSKKEIGRCFKLIIKSLETNLDQITSADFMVSSFTPGLSREKGELHLLAVAILRESLAAERGANRGDGDCASRGRFGSRRRVRLIHNCQFIPCLMSCMARTLQTQSDFHRRRRDLHGVAGVRREEIRQR